MQPGIALLALVTDTDIFATSFDYWIAIVLTIS